MGPVETRAWWRARVVMLVLTTSLIAGACGGEENEIPSSLALTDGVGHDLSAASATSAPERIAAKIDTSPSSEPIVPVVEETTTTTSTIPPDPLRTWVATAHADVPRLVAYDEPDGIPIVMEFTVPNPHQFGGPLTLMVTEGQPGDSWVRVQLPVRPNGQEGWIRAEDYDIAGTRVRAEVNLTSRTVVVFDGEDIIAETEAVIGAEATPTPLGTFSLAAKRENPPSESYLGPWALALSAYSEVYETFAGGIPVIAIHGTTRPDQVGQARSNGCIRIPNEIITFLAENVPLGAPVVIST